jgi:hypothetical protein
MTKEKYWCVNNYRRNVKQTRKIFQTFSPSYKRRLFIQDRTILSGNKNYPLPDADVAVDCFSVYSWMMSTMCITSVETHGELKDMFDEYMCCRKTKVPYFKI